MVLLRVIVLFLGNIVLLLVVLRLEIVEVPRRYV